MKLRELQRMLEQNPTGFPRFVLPDGDLIPPHAHLTEVSHVTRNFIDCGGGAGKEEKAVLQTHVGGDTHHRLSSSRFAKILQLAERVIPSPELDVEIEYDCCVVAQYPISAIKPKGDYLDIILERGHTQCRPRERQKSRPAADCCAAASACCD